MTVDVQIPNDLTEPRWASVGHDIFLRTYSRIKPDGSRETWADTVKRVVDGNCNFVGKRYIERGEPEKLFKLIYNFSILPGGRHLWSTGVKNRQYVSNCWTTGFDHKDFGKHFTFLFARLLEGGGVGSNYSNVYLRPYGIVKNSVKCHIVCDDNHPDYEILKDKLSNEFSPNWDGCTPIADSREGWVNALKIVIDAHFVHHPPTYEQPPLVFDVSHIRAAGSQIKGFGGTASGPAALVSMLLSVNKVLNDYVGKKPDSHLVLTLDHEIARCVVAGNVRRAARLAMKHWKDEDIFDFIHMKEDGTGHWTTNISVILDSAFWKAIRKKDKYARKVLKAIAEGALRNGEPGIFNITKAQEGELYPIFSTNPCGEITMGEWSACNLGSVNLKNFAGNKSEMMEAFRLLTRFLIRATYADFPDGTVKKLIERDRRLGVGFTGFADWLALEGVKYSQFPYEEKHKKILREAHEVVRNTAREYAFELRIPEPIKVTSVAPTGTTSKLCGVSEGLQPILYKYFKRRVNYSVDDESSRKTLERLEAEGYEIEDSAYTPGKTKVVTYYCKATILDDVDESMIEEAEDITLEDLLAVQTTVQDCYADNSISFTINVNPENVTVKELERAIVAYGPHLKGTTIMPSVSNRPQMPYERISKEEYEKASKKFTDVVEANCKNGVCTIVNKLADDDEKT